MSKKNRKQTDRQAGRQADRKKKRKEKKRRKEREAIAGYVWVRLKVAPASSIKMNKGEGMMMPQSTTLKEVKHVSAS